MEEKKIEILGVGIINISDFKEVNSTRIHSYLYLSEHNILLVRFVKPEGIVYLYKDVSDAAYNSLDQAESKGKAFSSLGLSKFERIILS